jgi:hypothetical protein
MPTTTKSQQSSDKTTTSASELRQYYEAELDATLRDIAGDVRAAKQRNHHAMTVRQRHKETMQRTLDASVQMYETRRRQMKAKDALIDERRAASRELLLETRVNGSSAGGAAMPSPSMPSPSMRRNRHS